jgi:hypothetical protein
MSGALQAVYQNFRSSADPKFIKTSTISSSNRIGFRATNLTVSSSGKSAVLMYYSYSTGCCTSQTGFTFNISDNKGTQLANVNKNKNNLGGADTNPYSITSDSSDNFYVAASVFRSASVPRNNYSVFKFNSSGTQQWEKSMTATSNPRNLTVDSSGNVYVTYNSTGGPLLSKFNSSGTVQWQRLTVDFNTQNMTTDSSGNIYLAGLGPDADTLYVLKYDSSGTLLSTKGFGTYPTTINKSGIAVDSSGNVYIAVTSNSIQHIAKLNSSFTQQWSRKLSGTGAGGNTGNLAVDSSGNVYVANSSGLIAKYNSSGTLQWQRRQTSASGGAIDSSDVYLVGTNVYFGGQLTDGAAVFTIGTDGTPATGTFTVAGIAFTYAAGAATDAAYTLGTPVVSITSTSTTITVSDGTFGTDNAVTSTNTTVTI